LRSNSLLYAGFFLTVLFKREDINVPPKRQLTFNRLQGLISQKREFFLFNIDYVPTTNKIVYYEMKYHPTYFGYSVIFKGLIFLIRVPHEKWTTGDV
jgi:hypothetical protein